MKKILPEYYFSDEQLNNIHGLAAECGLCPDTVKILYGRGIKDKQSIYDFMHPSKSHFISPFKMQGMTEAVNLIKLARDEDWSVVVYGDYDADGVCAATILGGALKDFGIQPYVCVPERRDGYGLSKALIDSIFDEVFPQLVITVDCGISCAEEVDYIKEMGAEVIVTDHHELPDKIPDCICINPKFNDGYIYDNLCGAGVAFKLGCALLGDEAYKYLDFAAIATVADSVPLTGENRDIVYEGLKLINNSPRDSYAQFLGKTDGGATSHTLAFSVAPKINAAGRMGDAKSALELFSETDKNKIYTLAAKLTEYNLERQQYCDELYLSAKEMLKEGVGSIIMLCNESWNSGFVGIVAARLADEYSRPAILFVKNGNMLKGSARSVESVNIFEALKACGEYIEEFGGHSQAAGVNVSEENFENLRTALENYVSQNFSKEEFSPAVYVNGILDKPYSFRFAKELEMLEPFGVGNRRPLFMLEENAVAARPVKVQSAHLSVKSERLEMMYFGGAKFIKLIESNAPKKFIFEYNVSSFRGKEYVKGFIRDVIYDNNAKDYVTEEASLSFLEHLALPDVDCEKKYITKKDVEEIIAADSGFGTVFITWDGAAANAFNGAEKLNCELFNPASKNFSSVLLFAPQTDSDLSGFSRVVFLDAPAGVKIQSLSGKKVEIYDNFTNAHIDNISCVREDLLKIFAAVSANEAFLDGATAAEVAGNNTLGFKKPQFMFALLVFSQLNLLSFADGKLKVCRGVKTDLSNSNIYNTVSKLKAEYSNGRS